jgi:hypothetical protein
MKRGQLLAAAIIFVALSSRADDFHDPHPFRNPASIKQEEPKGPAASMTDSPGYPLNNSTDDVTSTAQIEHQGSSSIMFRVSYRKEGTKTSRVFLLPKDLVSMLPEGGVNGTLVVKSLVLASNGEPKQLIIEEAKDGKKIQEIEFQVGWKDQGSSCSLSVQASSEETRHDQNLPVEESDCRHYIYNPDQNQGSA